MTASAFPAVHDLADLAVILAYQEDTSQLEAALRTEGFDVEIQRAHYNEVELSYSRSYRGFLNHLAAWRRAVERDTYTVIMESDFIPCEGFGLAPAPFDPLSHGPNAWAFLYAGGPRIIQAHTDGALEGHAACPVAIIVSPETAKMLVRFGEEELTRSNKTTHSMWDTYFQWHVMGWGGRCFLPLQNYGEHGGIANPEHRAAGIGWARHFPLLMRSNAFNTHRAECLLGALSFMPPYARGSRINFLLIRFCSRLIGFARLLTGRVAKPAVELNLRKRCRTYTAAFSRLFS